MPETKELIALRDALNEAIKTSRTLDRCHSSFLERRNDGLTRARQTTYAALATALKADIKEAKRIAIEVFNLNNGEKAA
ncbi:hypothetical protein LWH94_09655 [Marinobacter sp. G11]|uniref:hypothetical protein n=1 Tax=Marinobacter sp. G11 TaxID=2903522 RepID=UPI001E2A502A|nr:hypothetical protein [Marinobacter sp. G11]MCE0759468.1 hypothetical protein [Marinobacter sp. G11]